jgi:hypothetical protein
MTVQKLIVGLALLLSAISAVQAQASSPPSQSQNTTYHRPGRYFGNDYGPRFQNSQSRPGTAPESQL